MSPRDEVRDEFQCPICLDYMFPPIGECLVGHGFCAGCTRRLKQCPNCRAPIVYTKNHVLEQLHGKLEFPCAYREEGCEFCGKAAELKAHQDECPFRPRRFAVGASVVFKILGLLLLTAAYICCNWF